MPQPDRNSQPAAVAQSGSPQSWFEQRLHEPEPEKQGNWFEQRLQEHWQQFQSQVLHDHLRALAMPPEALAQRNTSASTNQVSTNSPCPETNADSSLQAYKASCYGIEAPPSDGTGAKIWEEEEAETEVGVAMSSRSASARTYQNEMRWGTVVSKLLSEAGVLHTGEFLIHDGWLEEDAQDAVVRESGMFSTMSRLPSRQKNKNGARSTLGQPPKKLISPPNSKQRLVWNVLCVLACLFDFISVPTNVAFSEILNPGEAMRCALLTFWVCDIVFSFLTGVYINGMLCMDPWQVATNYIKTWFALDVMLVIIDSTMLESSILNAKKAGLTYIEPLQALRLFRLLRMRKISYVLRDLHIDHLEGLQAYVCMTCTCITYLAGIHLVTCLWHGIRRKLNEGNGWLLDQGIGEDAYMQQYWSSVNVVHGFLLGSSAMTLSSSSERVLEAIFRFFGLLATAIFLAQANWTVKLLKETKTSKMRKACHSYLQSHSVPQRLAMLLKRYVETDSEFAWKKEMINAENALFQDLPKQLQTELFWTTRWKYLSTEDFILQMSSQFSSITCLICFEACSELLVRESEMVLTVGHRATDVLFLLSGTLKYALPRLKSDQTEAWMDVMNRVHILQKTHPICEPALWTKWFHKGKLTSETECSMMLLNIYHLREAILRFPHLHRFAISFARKYVSIMNNDGNQCTDITRHTFNCDDLEKYLVDKTLSGHVVFLSHYKQEAGTEAALLHDELLFRLRKHKRNGKTYEQPVFLDSEHLQDLMSIEEHVIASQNLVVLLTPGIFTRAWCVIELFLAIRNGVEIVPVEIQKPGTQFEYPDESFYAKLRSQSILDASSYQTLSSSGMNLADAEAAIRHTCGKVAVSFSPHKHGLLRDSEYSLIIERCLGWQGKGLTLMQTRTAARG